LSRGCHFATLQTLVTRSQGPLDSQISLSQSLVTLQRLQPFGTGRVIFSNVLLTSVPWPARHGGIDPFTVPLSWRAFMTTFPQWLSFQWAVSLQWLSLVFPFQPSVMDCLVLGTLVLSTHPVQQFSNKSLPAQPTGFNNACRRRTRSCASHSMSISQDPARNQSPKLCTIDWSQEK